MSEFKTSLILKTRIFLAITGVMALGSMCYYLMFNINVAAVITVKHASGSTALGLALPVLVSVIVMAYSYLDMRNMQRLGQPEMKRTKSGELKPKKLNREEKKEFEEKVRSAANSITGILVVDVVGLAYWIMYMNKVPLLHSVLATLNTYEMLMYQYLGTALLVIGTISAAIAVFFSSKFRNNI
jgi:ADP-ribosylglycohydrolase